MGKSFLVFFGKLRNFNAYAIFNLARQLLVEAFQSRCWHAGSPRVALCGSIQWTHCGKIKLLYRSFQDMSRTSIRFTLRRGGRGSTGRNVGIRGHTLDGGAVTHQ